MFRAKKVLILIPARGGSKRIPHKNRRLLGGKPLVSYAIKAARRSKYADRILVSTDDKKIQEIARKANAEVPFLRPKKLSGDRVSTGAAVIHALDYLKAEGWQPDIVVVVQPTSPLVQSSDMDAAIKILISSGVNTCVSVEEATERPEWMFKKVGAQWKQYVPTNLSTRSQDLPQLYCLNGAVYAALVPFVLRTHELIDTKHTAAIIMPKERSIDIDEEADWQAAERML
ncbi:MAG TPA: acylneuraminate cytidylyltransferase family protein [Candidatus Paceibacterota bacterium]